MPITYQDFIQEKSQSGSIDGFVAKNLPSFLFDFQRYLVEWSLLKGRSAIFADCGLGKTPMQLVWADSIVKVTNKPVLILTPLAVSAQTIQESEKFSIESVRSSDGKLHGSAKIVVTNYERLHHFDPQDFSGCVCDESSILKSFDGVRRKEITEFMRKMPYRLLCTATAAPNDYIELGTSSEALGELGHTDMLMRFFKNDQHTIKPMRYTGFGYPRGTAAFPTDKWRFKGHAEIPFWRWVCSWARAIRKPSDLGFSDDKFILPPLIESQYMVDSQTLAPGFLFSLPAVGLQEQREERRRTVTERCEKIAKLVDDGEHALIWCHLNVEGDMLEQMIPKAIQVKGSDSDEWKEMAALWFTGNKCICKEHLFRAKIATWRKNLLATGSGFIRSIAKNSPQKQKNIEPRTLNDGDNIPANTINHTNGCGSEVVNNRTKSICKDGNATLKIRKNGNGKNRKLNSTACDIPKQDSLDYSNAMESQLRNIDNLQSKAVQFADGIAMSITGDSKDSTLTTAMPQVNSEDSSAPLVILDSESLETVQNVLNEPSCICGHKSGQRILISKSQMFGYGLNFQHCAHVLSFPSHSFEQYYQGVRRCWRFGQTRPVRSDIVTTEGEKTVLQNLQKKSKAADEMFSNLVNEMNRALHVERDVYFNEKAVIPSWL